MTTNSDIALPLEITVGIHEAELYQSMGLLEPSLNIYKRLIADPLVEESQLMQDIRGRIDDLQKQIQAQEAEDASVSRRELAILQENQVAEDSVEALIGGAAALKDLGLFREACFEYDKAFLKNPMAPNLITQYIECLFHFQSPRQVVDHLSHQIHRQYISESEKAKLVSDMGFEFEKRGLNDYSIELYKSAIQMNPTGGEADKRLSALLSQLAPGSRYDYLIQEKRINPGQLQKALVMAQKSHNSVEYVLMEEFHISKTEIGESLSQFYNCPFKAFDPQHPVPFELIRNLKKSFLLHDVWVPLGWEKNCIQIIVDDPKDIRKTDHIKTLVKVPEIDLFVGIREDIEQFIARFYAEPSAESTELSLGIDDIIPNILFDDDEASEDEAESMDESTSQVVRLVDQVLVTAYRSNVSDIHIEPSPITNKTSIRFRMDGVCQEYLKVPNSMVKGILSRIKIMSNLDIAERRLPQDGKIKFRRKGVPQFELRVATIPTAGGHEDAVLRILASAGAMKLTQMGLNERNLKIMQKILAQPYGIILVVGPTGSGKTTSLHAALGYINKPGIKIWTAEDPVEITQQGLRQVEVKPQIGLTFARVMRSFLRADPDVIMIGEMRDEETAAIGIEASLTGHLVFSTLHTNSAPETITRLLDMGLNALNFSDAFLGVLAQRLIRTLCVNCRQPYHPSEEEFNDIVMAYGAEDFKSIGITYSPNVTLFRPVGCDTCSGSGYKGRMGIHELMEGTREIKLMIKKQASSEELFIQAASEGMTTLKQDGIQKVLQGVTDMQEVNRVCIG